MLDVKKDVQLWLHRYKELPFVLAEFTCMNTAQNQTPSKL